MLRRRTDYFLAILMAAGLATTAVAGVPNTHAQVSAPDVDAAPFLNASRMVTYTYNPDRSYVVRTVPDVYTVITVPKGEKIEGFYLSQASDWHFIVTKDQRRVLIQPSQSGLYNSALLVTSKRSYQLTIASVASTKPWFQSVTWRIPGAGQPSAGVYWVAGQKAGQAGSHSAQTATSPVAGINPSRLYTHYSIKGQAAFRPTEVFDDGTRTYLKLPAGVEDIPAIFAVVNGKLNVVNYHRKGHYIVVPRVVASLRLRLDGHSVTVTRGCDPTECLR